MLDGALKADIIGASEDVLNVRRNDEHASNRADSVVLTMAVTSVEADLVTFRHSAEETCHDDAKHIPPASADMLDCSAINVGLAVNIGPIDVNDDVALLVSAAVRGGLMMLP